MGSIFSLSTLVHVKYEHDNNNKKQYNDKIIMNVKMVKKNMMSLSLGYIYNESKNFLRKTLAKDLLP